MKLSRSAIILALAACGNAAVVDGEVMSGMTAALARDTLLLPRSVPKDFSNNNGRTVANGGCCNDGVNLRQDICFLNGQKGRCIPAATTREGCVGLTCVQNSKLTCDPNTLDRGRDKCTLISGQ